MTLTAKSGKNEAFNLCSSPSASALIPFVPKHVCSAWQFVSLYSQTSGKWLCASMVTGTLSCVCAFEEAQPLKHFVEVPWCQCFGQWSERGARYLWRRCQEKLQDVCPKATPVCQADGNCRATAFVQWDIALMLQNPGQEITQILENCSSIFNASFWPRDILEISVMRQRDGESKHRFEKKNVQPTLLPPT